MQFRFMIDDVDIQVPGRHEVCPRCRGNGTITNPSIGAITGEEWERDWSEQEREWYMEGVYNVPCPTCDGQRVIVVPDEEHLTEDDRAYLAEYRAQQQSLREVEHIMEMERRAGA